uniref:Myeloid differentiation factor 88 n=1 Tax=Holothuria leucospilota TaxID=206669 RepID=A0A346TPD7_HOLLE|nr:myeloid differentiation factor 88 [Holothuria leucospilota]
MATNSMDLFSIPIIALGPTVRMKLSHYLNPEKDFALNWRFLAEALDYETLLIENLEMKPDPTRELLKDWGSKTGNSIGLLVETLKKLERDDVVTDIGHLLLQDAEKWQTNRRREASRVQDPEVSSALSSANELRGITLRDDIAGEVERFDAYVCYCQEDFSFVKQMREILEGEYKLKLCIDVRDVVPGGSMATVTAELIENRCRRMMVILSPEFLKNDFGNFCVKFGVSLQPGGQSRKVIPVIVSPCDMPAIMMHLTPCDYTKKDVRPWFWQRLYRAIVAPL